MLKIPFFLILSCFIAAGFLAEDASLAANSELDRLSVGNNPEGTIYYGSKVFASNLGSSRNPAQDGDGYISSFDINSKELIQKYLPLPGDGTLDFPMGMIVVSDILYVVDLKRVVGFDIATRKKVFETSVPNSGVSYLNDIVYLGQDLLLVSATNLKKLFTVNFRTKIQSEVWKPFLDSESLQLVNGLSVDRDANLLYVVQNQTPGLAENNGLVSAYTLETGIQKLVWTSRFGRFLDGIAELPGEKLLVSDWNSLTETSVLHTLDSNNGSVLKSVSAAFQGLADINYDPYNNIAIYPAMLESSVYVDRSLFPIAKQIQCSPAGQISLGRISLSLDREGYPRQVQFENSQCPVFFSASDGNISWGRAKLERCSRVQSDILEIVTERNRSKNFVQLEIVSKREPDSCEHINPRLCNPSDKAYEYFICK